MGEKRKLSIRAIAQKLNLSVATVSRVINGKSVVNEGTRTKVLEEIAKSQYVPNLVARNLKLSKTKVVGFLVPDITENYFNRVIKGADKVLNNHDYMIFLSDFNENIALEKRYVEKLLSAQVDGIIVATLGKAREYSDLCRSKNVPLVFIDNQPELDKDYNSVLLDNKRAGYIAARHLIDKGHRNIGIIKGLMSESTAALRYEGYIEALKDSGIEPNARFEEGGDFKYTSGVKATEQLLERNPDMTAIIASSSKMARGAYSTLRNRGIDIPSKVALVGFDVKDHDNLIVPSMTSIIQPEEEIGIQAANLLLDKISNGDGNGSRILIEPILYSRDST